MMSIIFFFFFCFIRFLFYYCYFHFNMKCMLFFAVYLIVYSSGMDQVGMHHSSTWSHDLFNDWSMIARLMDGVQSLQQKINVTTFMCVFFFPNSSLCLCLAVVCMARPPQMFVYAKFVTWVCCKLYVMYKLLWDKMNCKVLFYKSVHTHTHINNK